MALVLLLGVSLPWADVTRAAVRRITVRAEDGVMLSGSYYEPERRPAPGIVLVHMLTRTHADWEPVAPHLADAGFAVVALDFRSGSGPSEALQLDVRAAKAFLRERPEVIASNLGLVGASVGANLVVLDAASDPSVRSVALLSPGLDYGGLRIDAAIKTYGSRPALLVASTKDPYSWRSVRQLALIGPGTREVRLTEALAHGTVLLSRDKDLVGALVDWFRRTLL